jgi:hypothetical protein
VEAEILRMLRKVGGNAVLLRTLYSLPRLCLPVLPRWLPIALTLVNVRYATLLVRHASAR